MGRTNGKKTWLGIHSTETMQTEIQTNWTCPRCSDSPAVGRGAAAGSSRIGRTPNEVLSCPSHAQHVVPFAGLRHADPARVVGKLAPRVLGEKAVSDSECEFSVLGELLNDAVILGKVLPTATGVADARDAKAVHLPHEMPRRVELIVERELGRSTDGGIENERIGLGNQ